MSEACAAAADFWLNVLKFPALHVPMASMDGQYVGANANGNLDERSCRSSSRNQIVISPNPVRLLPIFRTARSEP
jgi:hypothetical protein